MHLPRGRRASQRRVSRNVAVACLGLHGDRRASQRRVSRNGVAAKLEQGLDVAPRRGA